MHATCGGFGLIALAIALASTLATSNPASSTVQSWPAGTEVLPIENLEGIILLSATLRGNQGRDTTGTLVLDSGAGFLALDQDLAANLGIAPRVYEAQAPTVADRALSRLQLGTLQMDQISPVIALEMEVVRRVIDRPVLGLLGQLPLSAHAVRVDYSAHHVALIPMTAGASTHGGRPSAGGVGTPIDTLERGRDADSVRVRESRDELHDLLSPSTAAVPFRLAGDGKILVSARVSNPQPPHFGGALTLIVDTGASKCVLFEAALADRVPESRRWPALRGLIAPTLVEVASARMVRVPALEVDAGGRGLRLDGIDAAVLSGEFAATLSRAVGEPVHGLLGYSFLKRFRLTIDYPHRVLWLDPIPRRDWDDRPYEYSQVGLQLERRGNAARVIAVAEQSPAATAGIRPGDEIIGIDGEPAAPSDILTLSRRLEGPPGSRVRLTMRRGTKEREHRLVRRQLL